MRNEYIRLVQIIRSAEHAEEVKEQALHDLVDHYSSHRKINMPEARKYSKNAVLSLFKEGRLRGLTENLKGLKPTYIDIMDHIQTDDMDVFMFTPGDRHCFSTLRDKLEKEVEFIVASNEVKPGVLSEKINHISSEGVDDDIFALKQK